ncbi:MAG: hypothetical protein PF444_06450, partial [Bacteroidales bacterium]|nr:hypothetical protein [Bacteroidales bacterium]
YKHELTGVTMYGCNGPQPIFAHENKSKHELIEALNKTLKNGPNQSLDLTRKGAQSIEAESDSRAGQA